MDRGLRDKFFYGDCIGHDLFNYITANVEWKSGNISIYTKGRHNYEVKFGQIVTTKKLISEHLGVDPRVVTKKLDKLKKVGLISTENLYNCIRIQLCDAYMHAIVKPPASDSEPTCPTNEPGTINQSLDSNKLESCENPPGKPTKKSDEFDSEGTKNLFGNRESGKNTPPVPARGVGNGFTPEDLFRLWNERRGSLPKATKLTKDRTAKCKLRLKENPERDFWMTTIENLASSDFASQGKWANFDWILKNESNALKAFEGAYQNKKVVKVNPHAIQTEAAELPDGW